MPFLSPYESTNIPDVDVWQYLYENQRQLHRVPDDRIVFIDGLDGRTVTYGEHITLAQQFGAGLMQHFSWKKGDVLLNFSKNHVDSGTVCAGVLYAGGTHTAASAAFTSDELAYQIQDVDAKIVVVHPSLLNTAAKAVVKAGLSTDRLLVLGLNAPQNYKSWKHFCIPDSVDRPVIDPVTDISHIIHTSGSTGIPKGCMFTHRSMVAQLMMFNLFDTPDAPPEQARTVLFIPLFHVYGMIVRELFTSKGLQVVIVAEFSLPRVCELIERYKLTWFHGTPPVFKLLLNNSTSLHHNLSSLKRAMCAGSVLPADAVRAFYERFRVPVKNALGMTECVAAVASNLHENALETAGSVGYLMPWSIAKVIDQYGHEVNDCQNPGRLFVKNPCVMLGYKNRPGETKKTIQDDGFVDSGDFVRVGGDGLITVLGRFDELVRFHGELVLPTDMEEVICTHPRVFDCAVVSLPGKAGPAANPRAFVVLSPGTERTEVEKRSIYQFVVSKLSESAWLRGGVDFVDEIPRSPAGKTLRQKLKRDNCIGQGDAEYCP